MTAPVTDAPAPAPASSEPAAPAAAATPAAAPAVTPPEPAPAAAPVQYDLKLPADHSLDPAIVERTVALASAQGLSAEAGQGLLDAVVAEVKAQQDAQLAAWAPGAPAWKAREAEWAADALADPTIGGTPEKLAASVEYAQRALRTLGDEDFNKFLVDTGLGSHPAALRFLAKVGRGMSESTLVTSGQQSTGPSKKPLAETLYGPDGTGKSS